MYRRVNTGLGFDLFGLLRSGAKKVGQVLVKGGTITVPPIGTPTVAIQQPQPQNYIALQQPMPSWVIPAAIGAAALVLIPMLTRGRKS